MRDGLAIWRAWLMAEMVGDHVGAARCKKVLSTVQVKLRRIPNPVPVIDERF